MLIVVLGYDGVASYCMETSHPECGKATVAVIGRYWQLYWEYHKVVLTTLCITYWPVVVVVVFVLLPHKNLHSFVCIQIWIWLGDGLDLIVKFGRQLCNILWQQCFIAGAMLCYCPLTGRPLP